MNVLKVINDKLMLHPADWQQRGFDSIGVEMGDQVEGFISSPMERNRVRVSISHQCRVLIGLDPRMR